jgi:hypothetical protein
MLNNKGKSGSLSNPSKSFKPLEFLTFYAHSVFTFLTNVYLLH